MLPVPTSLNISASQGFSVLLFSLFCRLWRRSGVRGCEDTSRSGRRARRPPAPPALTTSLEDVEECFCFMKQLATPHLFSLPLRIWTEAMVEFCLHPVYLPIELGEDLHQGHLSALTLSVVEANEQGLYTMLECR